MDKLDIDLTKFPKNDAIVYFNEKETKTSVKYKELTEQIEKINSTLSDPGTFLRDQKPSLIGIHSKKSPVSVAISFAIINSGFGFCFLIKDNITCKDLDELQIKYFLSSSSFGFKRKTSLEIFGEIFQLYETSDANKTPVDNNGDTMNNICYSVTTSGSTGKRKIVRVPFKCIKPNIFSLQKIYNLRNDVILTTSPVTFDVFILEMFLTMYSGSTLLIINDKLRYSEWAVSLISNYVTFMQTTPSLFKNYGIDTIRNKILSESSSIR